MGFEPTEPFGSPVFKTGSLSHSDTLPLTRCTKSIVLVLPSIKYENGLNRFWFEIIYNSSRKLVIQDIYPYMEAERQYVPW